MSKNNKYYHNDIKKSLGIDETISASEKVLDSMFKRADKRSPLDNPLLQNSAINQYKSEVKKKVKQSSQYENPTSNLQILQVKLLKNICGQLNISKMIKSLTILKKCLCQQTFLNDPEINFKQTWIMYANKLIGQISQKNYCSGESNNLMENIGDILQIMLKRWGYKRIQHSQKSKTSSDKLQQCNQQKQQILDKQQQQIGQISNIDHQNNPNDKSYETNLLQNIEINIFFCRLFTGDSFIFSKHINSLKKIIFSEMQIYGTVEQQQRKTQLQKIILKLVTMPIKNDWAFSIMVSLFKQFNNNGYHNIFQEEYRKNYLKKYNEFLNKKPKSSLQSKSYDMMGGKNVNGLRTTHIQAISKQGSDKWVEKQ